MLYLNLSHRNIFVGWALQPTQADAPFSSGPTLQPTHVDALPCPQTRQQSTGAYYAAAVYERLLNKHPHPMPESGTVFYRLLPQLHVVANGTYCLRFHSVSRSIHALIGVRVQNTKPSRYSVNVRGQALKLFKRLVVTHHYERYTVKQLIIVLDSPHDGCTFKLGGAPRFLIRERQSAQNPNPVSGTIDLFLSYHRTQPIGGRVD